MTNALPSKGANSTGSGKDHQSAAMPTAQGPDGVGGTGTADGPEADGFDFEAHRQQAIDKYQPLVKLYADYAYAVYSILRARLDTEGISVNSIEHRAKSVESLGDKAQKPADDDPNRPKYGDPLDQITDLAGVRIITNFLSTEQRVDRIIEADFDVIEKADRSELLHQEERFGYQSIHYLGQS